MKKINSQPWTCVRPLLGAAAVTLLLAACNNDDNPEQPQNSLSSNIRTLASDNGLTGDPTTGRDIPSITTPVAQLGKALFFTKGLGGDSDSACVTCHHPSLGGGDDLSLPIGVGAEAPNLLGPGRFHDSTAAHFIGGPTVPRNAPTTFNLALWDQALFHDGRVESIGKTAGQQGNDGQGIRTPDSAFGTADPNAGNTLAAAQARFPVTSPEEMRGFIFEAGNSNADVRTSLSAKLAATPAWEAAFNDAFGDTTINYGRIAEAIGAYERSQVFINTPWKAFLDGDDNAIDDTAKRGAQLFFTSTANGGAGCSSCHSGDFFTDEQYYVTAMPQIGRGKGNDNGTLTNDDFGRFRETGDAADKYKFRTPGLLNVEVTGPWGHDGAYTSLKAVVKHMLNPADAVANYDFNQLAPNVQADNMLTNTQFALDQLEANRTANTPNVLQNVELSDAQVDDLVAFLKALTDPCVKERQCLAPWIPNAGDIDPDNLRVDAVDRNGEFL